MTFDDIVRLYHDTESIKAVSRETGISEQTIRRVLILTGEYSSARSAEISTLYDHGLSIDDIAAELGISKKTVLAYIPYTRNPYATGEKTDNAKKIKMWRNRRSKG